MELSVDGRDLTSVNESVGESYLADGARKHLAKRFEGLVGRDDEMALYFVASGSANEQQVDLFVGL